MSQSNVITGSDSTPVYRVRKIGPADLKDALAKGLADFSAKPSHLVFLGLIYPLVGIGLVVGASPQLIFPLLSGFALIGPFAGIGLYEISQARELGLDTSWKHAFAVVRSHSIFPILSLGLLLLVIFGCWLFAAQALYVSLLGPAPPQSFTQFITTIFDTPQGWKLIGFGTGIGFVFAVLALSLSVVSFPMLLDRPIDAVDLDVGIEHPVVNRRSDRHSNIHQDRAGESVHHGALGVDSRGVPGHRFLVGLCRSRGCGARSRAFDLASLPQGRRTGGKQVRRR